VALKNISRDWRLRRSARAASAYGLGGPLTLLQGVVRVRARLARVDPAGRASKWRSIVCVFVLQSTVFDSKSTATHGIGPLRRWMDLLATL